MTRGQAVQILHQNMQSTNLRRHCYAVEAVMQALAQRLGGDPEVWGIAGLLHDADYEQTKENTAEHTKKVVEWMKQYDPNPDITNAILAHGWGFVEGNPEPKTKMEWALYCCDELTGFIVAVALVRPDPPLSLDGTTEGQGKSKLQLVTVDNILKKWPEKSFAAGVHRGQIELCEEKLGMPLKEFVEIALTSMQAISRDLGL